ncbi:hypothetical protein PR048_003051 [Dryococelus australis]|uniref:Uncharacterized protein n=1 Tax=Dryococelus australis TaxID=614101 RepID=A0ABQ9IM15_9NEOP|nr:hypothetical protein PR048_003051 [Dryococelus australis]
MSEIKIPLPPPLNPHLAILSGDRVRYGAAPDCKVGVNGRSREKSPTSGIVFWERPLLESKPGSPRWEASSLTTAPNRIRLERASHKQSSDTHKTPYDRVKRCRERKINTKVSERVNVDVFTQNQRPCPQRVAVIDSVQMIWQRIPTKIVADDRLQARNMDFSSVHSYTDTSKCSSKLTGILFISNTVTWCAEPEFDTAYGRSPPVAEEAGVSRPAACGSKHGGWQLWLTSVASPADVMCERAASPLSRALGKFVGGGGGVFGRSQCAIAPHRLCTRLLQSHSTCCLLHRLSEVLHGSLPVMRQTGNTVDCMRSVNVRHLSSKCCDNVCPMTGNEPWTTPENVLKNVKTARTRTTRCESRHRAGILYTYCAWAEYNWLVVVSQLPAEPMRVIEVCMEQRRNERAGEAEIPEKTRRRTASSGTIPTCEYPVTRLGIEPDSPWWRRTGEMPQRKIKVGIVPDDDSGRRVFSEISRFPALSFWCCSILTSITLVGFQDPAVKSPWRQDTVGAKQVPLVCKASGWKGGGDVCLRNVSRDGVPTPLGATVKTIFCYEFTHARWSAQPARLFGCNTPAIHVSAARSIKHLTTLLPKAYVIKAVHNKVSTFEINLRKKALLLHAYILTGALSDTCPVKLVTMEGKVVPYINVEQNVLANYIAVLVFGSLGIYTHNNYVNLSPLSCETGRRPARMNATLVVLTVRNFVVPENLNKLVDYGLSDHPAVAKCLQQAASCDK